MFTIYGFFVLCQLIMSLLKFVFFIENLRTMNCLAKIVFSEA